MSDEPPTDGDAPVLAALNNGFDQALADANQLDSLGLTIHGEAEPSLETSI